MRRDGLYRNVGKATACYASNPVTLHFEMGYRHLVRTGGCHTAPTVSPSCLYIAGAAFGAGSLHCCTPDERSTSCRIAHERDRQAPSAKSLRAKAHSNRRKGWKTRTFPWRIQLLIGRFPYRCISASTWHEILLC